MSSADIATIVTVYNQDVRSCLLSMASAALQEGCSSQIVIADDCSQVDNTAVFEDFLSYSGASDHVVVRHCENRQTVRNILESLPYVEAPYVRELGAGDLYYSEHALARMKAFLDMDGGPCAFGLIIAFEPGEDMGRVYGAPTNASDYVACLATDSRDMLRHQLLAADWVPGPAQFWRTEALASYLTELSDSLGVRYCEDFALTLLLRHETPHFLDEPLVWYELGSGISTTGSRESVTRMYNDHEHLYSALTESSKQRLPLALFRFRKLVATKLPGYRFFQQKKAQRYMSYDKVEGHPTNDFFKKCHQFVDGYLEHIGDSV